MGVVRRWKFEKGHDGGAGARSLTALSRGILTARSSPQQARRDVGGLCHRGHCRLHASRGKQKLNEWLKSGLLTKGTYKSPKTKKDTEKLEVDAQKRAALIERLTRERNEV